MLSYQHTTTQKTNNAALIGQPKRLPASVFVKPFMLATLAAVVMPLFIGFVLSLVSDALFAGHQTSNHPAPNTQEYSLRPQPNAPSQLAETTLALSK